MDEGAVFKVRNSANWVLTRPTCEMQFKIKIKDFILADFIIPLLLKKVLIMVVTIIFLMVLNETLLVKFRARNEQNLQDCA